MIISLVDHARCPALSLPLSLSLSPLFSTVALSKICSLFAHLTSPHLISCIYPHIFPFHTPTLDKKKRTKRYLIIVSNKTNIHHCQLHSQTKRKIESNRIKTVLESDNPGSTDSEVRKILTLHIPITEYDTLGSESDNDVSARALNSAKYRAQRGEF